MVALRALAPIAESYRIVLRDAEKAGLKPPYHVYAR